MANAHYMAKDGLEVTNDDRGVTWLPYYHDMGLVGFLLMPMACQMSVDVLPTREFARRPLLWLTLITRNRGTISFSPSFGYELCTRRAQTASTDGLDLSTWRRAGIGGDMIRPHVLTRFAERFATHDYAAEAFVPCYGMAEATLALSFTPPGKARRKMLSTAPFWNASIAPCRPMHSPSARAASCSAARCCRTTPSRCAASKANCCRTGRWAASSCAAQA